MNQCSLFQSLCLCGRTTDAMHSFSHEDRNDILIDLYQICDNHIFRNLLHCF